MKTFTRLAASALLICVITSLHAQAPFSFTYQAVVRDEAGQPIPSENITLGVSILQGAFDGPQVFSESHDAMTNDFGLVNLQIGSLGDLSVIDWSEGPFFIEISLDGQVMGSSQLLSVPYALHALSSADSFSGHYEDLENLPDLGAFIGIEDPQSGDIIYYHDGWHRLPIGEEGDILTIVEGMPQWYTPPVETTVTDIDGNVYPIIQIGDQWWMAENLRTTRYANGTDIPTGLTNTEWTNTDQGAFAIYPHGGGVTEDDVAGITSDEEMVEAYGLLYNWYAVDDPRGICPAGWHVPTNDDWTALTDYLSTIEDEDFIGDRLKSCLQVGSPVDGCDVSDHPRWESHDFHYGTDDFNFGALPAGYRFTFGDYFNIGLFSFWWSSTESTQEGWELYAHHRFINYNLGAVTAAEFMKTFGFSVRCVKGED